MNKKGFTLVEMLVVIAIIAVLVAIIVPTAVGATKKAAAATNAANLRSYASQCAIYDLTKDESAKPTAPKSKSCDPVDANIEAVCYSMEGTAQAFFKVGDKYYGVDYFEAIAEGRDGSSAIKSSVSGSEIGK